MTPDETYLRNLFDSAPETSAFHFIARKGMLSLKHSNNTYSVARIMSQCVVINWGSQIKDYQKTIEFLKKRLGEPTIVEGVYSWPYSEDFYNKENKKTSQGEQISSAGGTIAARGLSVEKLDSLVASQSKPEKDTITQTSFEHQKPSSVDASRQKKSDESTSGTQSSQAPNYTTAPNPPLPKITKESVVERLTTPFSTFKATGKLYQPEEYPKSPQIKRYLEDIIVPEKIFVVKTYDEAVRALRLHSLEGLPQLYKFGINDSWTIVALSRMKSEMDKPPEPWITKNIANRLGSVDHGWAKIEHIYYWRVPNLVERVLTLTPAHLTLYREQK